jgi:nitrite reductase (NADH) small subunit
VTAAGTRTTHRLGPVEQVPVGEGRAFAVGDEQVAVFRLRDGGLRATQARCPHAGGPLADGIAADCSVICPLHERRFALDTGEPIGHDGPAVVAHRVEVRGEAVFVAVGVPATAMPAAA